MDDERTGTTWRIDVSDADIKFAKRAWVAARDAALPDADLVARLYDDLARLVSAQAQQIADDFRAGLRR